MNIKEAHMDAETREIGLYKVLLVYEKIDLYNLAEFKNMLFSLTNGHNTHVAVELPGNRSDMPSCVIGALISGQKKMAASKGSFIVINSSESVTALLALSGLKDFFTTVEDAELLA